MNAYVGVIVPRLQRNSERKGAPAEAEALDALVRLYDLELDAELEVRLERQCAVQCTVGVE